MTLLFVSGQVTASGQDVALVTPTTSGFRAAMGKQGVKFATPLVPLATSPDQQLDDASASNWLKSIVTPDVGISLYPCQYQ